MNDASQRRLAMACIGAVSLSLAGCLEVERWVLRIDLGSKRGELRFGNVTSDGIDQSGKKSRAEVEDEDFRTLVDKFLRGDGLDHEYPRWRIEARELVEESGQLVGVVRFSFEEPGGMGIDAYDAARPYRYCPRRGRWITATNASWRDAQGCVIWPRSARQLEIEETASPAPAGASLLGRYRAWKAGQPRPDGKS
jgi:hypothetical protein